MNNLARAMSGPLGYWIGAKLEQRFGKSSYLIGTTMSGALVEFILESEIDLTKK
jgi:hypothetical protein